mmetsp:Transcript_26147/g.61234  ORF Transcript_26147/g.61234 Transcript_26147/m.61234 type:complete len:323 (-) Transcript_26147:37-1005(-)
MPCHLSLFLRLTAVSAATAAAAMTDDSCLLAKPRGISLAAPGQFKERPDLAKTSVSLIETLRSVRGNWTGLMDFRFDPDTLEVLQTSDYGAAASASASSPWTVYFSSSGNEVGEKRSERLQERCQKEGLKCIQLSADNGSKNQALASEFLMGLSLSEKSDDDAAIFAEDDTIFINNFGEELRRSLEELPEGWQVFWLCPGFLHSRKVVRPLGQAFQLLPQGDLSEARKSQGGRVYLDWPMGTYGEARKGVLAGSPATGVIKKNARPLFKKAIEEALAKGEDTLPDDVFFRDLGMQHQSEHFVAAEPQLCIEERSVEGFPKGA